MGIKTILTLLTIGGMAGAGFYFKDGIKDAFASGKESINNAKDTLQDGYSSQSISSTDYVMPVDSSKQYSEKGSGGYAGKESTEYVYIPIYQNNGQTSLEPTVPIYQNKGATSLNTKVENSYNSKPNPSITDYNKSNEEKTIATFSNFTSNSAKNNVKEYAKRKYGIDSDLLTKAVSKPSSSRTTQEKMQIEAEKARQIYDSRKYANW